MSRHKRSRSDLGTASKTNPFKAPKLGKPQPLPQRGNPSLNRAQSKRSQSDLGNSYNKNSHPRPSKHNAPTLAVPQSHYNKNQTKVKKHVKKQKQPKPITNAFSVRNNVKRLVSSFETKPKSPNHKQQADRKRNNRQNNVVRNANKKKQTKVNKQTDVSSLKRANRTHIKRGQSIQRIVVTPKTKDAKSSAGTKASKSQIQSMSRHKRSRSDLGTASKTNPFKAPKLGKPQPLPQRGNPSLNRAQ
eukprot:476549_1